jgi:hypothetical protein
MIFDILTALQIRLRSQVTTAFSLVDAFQRPVGT